jgi:hypothetical protein
MVDVVCIGERYEVAQRSTHEKELYSIILTHVILSLSATPSLFLFLH